MANYLVTYDLHEASRQKYENLDMRLGLMGGKRVLESAWVVPYSGDSNNLYSKVVYEAINPDEVIITRLTGDTRYALSGDHLKNALGIVD